MRTPTPAHTTGRPVSGATTVSAANLAALGSTATRPGWRAYNVASGRPATIGAMAAGLSRAAGGPPPAVTGSATSGT